MRKILLQKVLRTAATITGITVDCPEDSSDENECNIMTLSKGCDKKYPSEKNTTIFIALEGIDIVEIDELNRLHVF